MLAKAIVEKVINEYSAKVRIPIYHQIDSSPFATTYENLPTATICSIPGIKYALRKGDVVFVDFEMDQIENPVIIGCLSTFNSKSSCDIQAQSISVAVNATLPQDTSFGEQADIDNINKENAISEIIDTGVSPESDIEFYTY